VESLFSILLSLHEDAPIAIIQFLFGSLTIGVVALYGRHVAGNFGAVTAASALLIQWMFWWEMATGYIDLGLTAFAALCVYSLERSREPASPAWELLAAIFAGLAATCKLQGMWVLITFVVLVLLNGGTDSFRQRATRAFRLGMIALCIVVPWYIRTWVVTGNPVYPILYDVFGGAEWTTEGWRRYVESYLITDAISTGLPLTPDIVYTTYVVRVVLGFILATVAVLATLRFRFSIPIRFVALFSVSILLGSASNARFLLPSLPAFAVALSIFLQRWQQHLPVVMFPVAATLAIWIATTKVEPDIPLATRCALGMISREEYMKSDASITDYDVAQFANRYLPADSRILLCLQREHTALYLHQTFWANCRLQDSFHYDSEERLLSDIHRLRVTHLVLTSGFTEWYGSHPVWKARKEVELPALEALAERSGTRLFEANGVSLWRLNLPALP
jgi:hypothetical protein